MNGDLTRRDLIHRAMVVSAAAATTGAASSGTAAADDDGIMPEPGVRHAFVNPGIEALYNYVTAYGDEGYTQESVHEMSAENYKLRVYQGVDSTKRQVSGAVENLENFVRPDDPTASPLAEMAYSVLRTTALEALQEGKSVTDARLEGVDAALEELTIPYRNTCHQWNEMCYDTVRYMLAYLDDEADVDWGIDGDVNHSEGETLGEITLDSDVLDENKDGLPGWPAPFDHCQYDMSNPTISTEELTVPNGESIEVYRMDMGMSGAVSTFRNHIKSSSAQSISSDGSCHDVRVYHDSGPSLSIMASWEVGIYRILNAIEDIADDIQGSGGDAVEDVMEAHNAGDVSEMDLLSSYDIVREYGDSNEMTRYTAELLAAGLDAQDDVTHLVTIDHPDTGERTGRLFLSWDWSELRSWEYDYDPEDNSLEIDPASIDDNPELTVEFADETIELTADDLEDGFVDFEEDYGLLEGIERHSQGELHSHIPVGEETSHWDNAIFLHDDGDGGANQVWLDAEEPFELVAVEDEDGNDLDALELNGWQNQERDPALSLQEAARAEQQFADVSELEETGGDGIGFPSLDEFGANAWALLLGIGALVAAVLATQDGDGGGGSVHVHNHDRNDRNR